MSSEVLESSQSIVRLTPRKFELFRDLIYRETGISLKALKAQMLSARLSRRLRALNLSSFDDYYDLLKTSDPQHLELREMVNAITTNLTAFFREPAHFVYLRSWLAELARHQRRFRIWCAASSTGQEPYSLAITVHEAFTEHLPAYDVRILATDIDTQVLETARQGVYRISELESVSLEQRRLCFLRGKRSQSGFTKIKPAVSQLISFRQLNLIAPVWPVRGPLDVIFCRNVLIYFDDKTQRVVVDRLRALIRPGGLLFLGHSESLHWAQKILQPVGHAIYQIPRDS